MNILGLKYQQFEGTRLNFIIDEKKPEKSPNLAIESKKATVKSILFEKNIETPKVKTNVQTVKTSSDCKKELKKEKTVTKQFFEKIKKNKSLDQVKKVKSRNLSKTALKKRVSDIFQRVRNEKSTSEVELVRTVSKTPNKSKTFLPAVLDKYSTDLNFFNYCPNIQPVTFNNCQSAAGKSLSFDSLRYSTPPRHLPKSLSVENSKNKTNERPIGVFNVSKRSYTQTSDAPGTRNLTESLCSNPIDRKIFAPHKICTDGNKLYQKNSSDNNLLEYPNYSVALNEESNFRDSSLETLLRTQPCNLAVSSTKKQNEQTFKDHPQEKKTVEICQCLHFHTEDGIKKICIQNNSPKTKELGKKFFRVNYFPRGHEEDEEEEEEAGSKVELVDTGTDPEPREEQKKTSTSKVDKKQIRPKGKVPSKNSVHSNGGTKGRVKEEKSKPKGKEEEAENFVLVQDGNKTQVLEQPALPQKEESTSQRTLEEAKSKKKATRKRQKSSSKPRSAGKDKDEKDNFKETELLENLEKLFVRLNSTENSRIRRKMSKMPAENKKLDKDVNKNTGTVENACSSLLLLDLEEEEEFLRRRKKLRTAIIRQLRNWVEVNSREK